MQNMPRAPVESGIENPSSVSDKRWRLWTRRASPSRGVRAEDVPDRAALVEGGHWKMPKGNVVGARMQKIGSTAPARLFAH